MPEQAGPGTFWFTLSSFANAATGAIGNVGRNILHGPRLFAINGSAFRKFNTTERRKLEFRAEAFKLTNRRSSIGRTPRWETPRSAGSPPHMAVRPYRQTPIASCKAVCG